MGRFMVLRQVPFLLFEFRRIYLALGIALFLDVQSAFFLTVSFLVFFILTADPFDKSDNAPNNQNPKQNHKYPAKAVKFHGIVVK